MRLSCKIGPRFDVFGTSIWGMCIMPQFDMSHVSRAKKRKVGNVQHRMWHVVYGNDTSHGMAHILVHVCRKGRHNAGEQKAQ